MLPNKKLPRRLTVYLWLWHRHCIRARNVPQGTNDVWGGGGQCISCGSLRCSKSNIPCAQNITEEGGQVTEKVLSCHWKEKMYGVTLEGSMEKRDSIPVWKERWGTGVSAGTKRLSQREEIACIYYTIKKKIKTDCVFSTATHAHTPYA